MMVRIFPFSAQPPFETVGAFVLYEVKIRNFNFNCKIEIVQQIKKAREERALVCLINFLIREKPASRFPYIFVHIPKLMSS